MLSNNACRMCIYEAHGKRVKFLHIHEKMRGLSCSADVPYITTQLSHWQILGWPPFGKADDQTFLGHHFCQR